MAWAANEVLTRPDMRTIMQQRGLEPVCSSKAMVFVGEAFLMISVNLTPDKTIGGCGWKSAAGRLVKAALVGSSVYIDAYDAESSHTYMLTLAAEDIPALLVPNGSILSKGVLTQPTTPTEMYSQLLDLLHLEKNGNKRLQERWRNLNDTLHSKKTDFKGQLCYEAALGELYLTTYIPEFSAHVSLLVNDEMRLALFRNAG
eukprot:gene26468-35126_t